MAEVRWTELINSAPDPERADRFFELLRQSEGAAVLEDLDPEQARRLITIISASEAIPERLCLRPEWLEMVLQADAVELRRSRAAMVRDALHSVRKSDASQDPFATLGLFKERELIRIAVRDLLRMDPFETISCELAWLADAVLEAALRLVFEELIRTPNHSPDSLLHNALRDGFAVLGLGKLGGLELNYHSDIDLMFLCEESADELPDIRHVVPKGSDLADLYSKAATRLVTALSGSTTSQIYRVDLRLRPDAPHGPIVISPEAAEAHYTQRGQAWERLMLIKARCSAGSARLTEEFLEAVQRFRYPKTIDPAVLEQISEMKERMEDRLGHDERVARNLKHGRGGIREIEFVVQGLQLIHGGKNPFLQEPNTLKAINRLIRYEIIPVRDGQLLSSGYVLLRELEHRIQLDRFQQTHSLPDDPVALRRLAKLTGFEDQAQLLERLNDIRSKVRTVYENFLPSQLRGRPRLPDPVQDQQRWLDLLCRHSFRDPEHSLKMIQTLIYGSGFQPVSSSTRRAAMRLVERILERCIPEERVNELRRQAGLNGDPRSKWLSDPDRVLTRLVSYVERYGARSTLLEIWNANPEHFEMVVYLFDRSEFLAELALEEPDLIENLALSGHLHRRKNTEQLLRELRLGSDEDDQPGWIRRYHRTEFMRIGLRDILGLSTWMQSLEELSFLAEACLEYALEVALKSAGYHAVPVAVIGLGKLGGAELNYGSDLDILLVAENQVDDLFRLQHIGHQLIKLISERTVHGMAFPVDTRLRPDGEKGLLVNTLEAHKEYYWKRGRLWEIQTLTRARPVAGNRDLGKTFMQFVRNLVHLDQSRPPSAWTPDWVEQLRAMRQRIASERTPRGKDAFSLKTGSGGLMDAEFIAQLYCLQTGQVIPNTLAALQHAHRSGWLTDQQIERLIPAYLHLRRIEAVLRRWSYQAESELPDDPAPLRRVAIRCGFITGEDLLCAVQRYKNELRAVYEEVFNTARSRRGS